MNFDRAALIILPLAAEPHRIQLLLARIYGTAGPANSHEHLLIGALPHTEVGEFLDLALVLETGFGVGVGRVREVEVLVGVVEGGGADGEEAVVVEERVGVADDAVPMRGDVYEGRGRLLQTALRPLLNGRLAFHLNEIYRADTY